MKKLSLYILLFVVAISFVSTFASCTSSNEKNNNFDLINYENVDVNYNNSDANIDYSFWFNNGNLYYFKEGLINKTLVCRNKQSETKLFSNLDLFIESGFKTGEIYDVQACGDFVYAWYYTKDEDIFYKIDKSNNEIQEITRVNDVYRWVVKDNILVYTINEKYIDEELASSALYICNLNDKKVSKIASDVLDLGVVNDYVRYVTYKQDDLNQSVYEYSLANFNNRKITEDNFFKGVDLENYSINWCDFDFTDEKIICDYDQNYNITILDVNSLEIKKLDIHEFYDINIIGDYIFADIGGDESETHIERINLKDGSRCVTYIGDRVGEIFILNENQIMVNSSNGKIYFVNVNENCTDLDEVIFDEQHMLK